MAVTNPIYLLLAGWLLMALMMSVLFVVQYRKKQADIVDVGWAFGLGVLGILYAVAGDGYPVRRLILGALSAGWSFRLAGYLFVNRFLHPEEDGRYVALREGWRTRLQLKFFVFFQAQGLLDVILSLSFLVVAFNQAGPLSYWDFLGCVVWIIAVGGEVIADRQLAIFRADPDNRGQVCRVGLWRLSRHPNYFFEWIHWWSYVFLAVGSAYWWLTLAAPALMLFFILKVTGIPPTEARAIASRGDAYREYQRTTSAFVPWFPKESS
jgi:steroid 5-alpha reductase family enzyme